MWRLERTASRAVKGLNERTTRVKQNVKCQTHRCLIEITL